ncbi:MAG: HAMP domain-containing sensor histidine kinase [Gemmatimonadaceae bacterium]
MNHSTDVNGRATSPERVNAPMLGRRWWMPSAFAILALLLLLIVPAVVNRRISQVRSQLTLGSEHARVLVNDLEAAFAGQLLAQRIGATANDPAFATRRMLNADEIELHPTVRDVGPQAVALYNDLTDRLAVWNTMPHDGSAAQAQQGLDLLASAERLDNFLAVVSDQQRAQVRRLESYYVVTPAILAPVALLAILIVMWSGRRVLRFARLAEEERAQVVRASEARAALLRGVTHDVKNPLGAAMGYAQLLEEGVVGSLQPRQTEMVQRIHRLLEMSVQTVTDLLELARAEGELQIEYATVDLAKVVSDVVDDHAGMARERKLHVVLTVPATPVVTDPVRVRQILSNLLSNAIKYTPEGGQIRISILANDGTAPEPRRVAVEVRDTGPGIPKELQPKVFDEFFRVRPTGPGAVNGNGLGLAISRRIARLLGGDVTFAEGEGGGSAFTLWFAPG